jgi:hypothetical protein
MTPDIFLILGSMFLGLTEVMPTVSQLLAALASGGIGGAVVAFSLSRWLGDIWLGRILAKEKAKYDQELELIKSRYAEKLEGFKDALDRSKNFLQAQIDRSVFVTRAHFETEFDAYKKLFEDLAEVRMIMSIMHPILRVQREGETEQEKLKELGEKFAKLTEAHDKAARTVENLSPFVPQDILDKINRCLQLVRIEVVNVQTANERIFSSQWNREGEQLVSDFMVAYGAATKTVRNRIETLAILPSQN